jgi:hypothetical protein
MSPTNAKNRRRKTKSGSKSKSHSLQSKNNFESTSKSSSHQQGAILDYDVTSSIFSNLKSKSSRKMLAEAIRSARAGDPVAVSSALYPIDYGVSYGIFNYFQTNSVRKLIADIVTLSGNRISLIEYFNTYILDSCDVMFLVSSSMYGGGCCFSIVIVY